MTQGGISYFGIRHHGPGSAASLVRALQELQPAAVLIEGPVDASPLLPLLASPDMKPPVALLCYPEDDPAATRFWPFAEFSPEYQAALWAVANKAALRFIDLPSAARLAEHGPEGSTDADADEPEATEEQSEASSRILDPIGTLARAAGYEDGESWWSDIIEQNPAPGPIFAAIADAMTTLRDGETSIGKFEAMREAHMRLEIAAARKEIDGPLAVVCGAWHVPALQAAHTQKSDQALLKGIGRRKTTMTFAPWTGPRLALGYDYGAGVVAPGWSKHLWQTRGQDDASVLWLARIASVLRAKGHIISTASLIEAERLARALAAIRERPKPGFEELREASIAALFNGEALLWKMVEAELLLGADVGEIPADTPLAPLIDDLQRNQKAARLKPEALERELSIDLRSESGLFRSTLLHRLNVLGVNWGRLTDVGRSRGTFRERWLLAWQPEYAVRLVENLIYGPTIEKAANGRLVQMIGAASTLDALATLVQSAITAALSEASAAGLAALEEKAAHSSECLELLASVPPLADIIRYGEARKTETQRLAGLLERLVIEGAIALPYAARDLDAQAAAALMAALSKADEAIRLVEPDEHVLDAWRNGLAAVLDSSRSTALVAGCAAHLLYEAGHLSAEATAGLLAKRLSPGTPVIDAAAFFEGFFSGAGQRLIYDEGLRGAVDSWLASLDEDAFVAHLPLLRRVFSNLDSMERRRLIEAVLGRRASLPAGLTPAPMAARPGAGILVSSASCLRGSPTMDDETVGPDLHPIEGTRERRWRLAIGADDESSSALSQEDRRLSAALDALYGDGSGDAGDPRKRRGGLGRSAPRVAQWMGDIRSFFPEQVVQVVQKDAFERLNLKQMLMEPEFLKAIEADVNLVADLVSLRSAMPEKTKDIARSIISDIVAKLMQRLEQKTAEAIRGALDRSRRTNRPRQRDIDWPRTIAANLRHYQPDHKTVVPEKLVGFMRRQRRLVDLDEVTLCVDQSGSMASSVIYASIFAAVMASLPVVRTKLVCFDTAIVDLTDELSDPVEVLFGVQLGGGTDINQAVAYCAERIERPTKAHFVLITDLYEGGNGQELLRRLAALVRSGVNVVVLLALTDQGRPGYDSSMAGSVAALGVPVFACTPDHFPDMMAAALRREDIGAWAAGADIKLVRPDSETPSAAE